MNSAAHLLCQTKQIQSYEQLAKRQLNLSEETLMLRAGEAAFNVFLKFYSHCRSIAVFCGGGNNAGDGYVFARKAREAGFKVSLYALKPADKLPPPAREAAMATVAAGVASSRPPDKLPADVEIIVDALLGIGLREKIREPLSSIISIINNARLPTLALDLPSGLNADTGMIEGVCVKATLTITFIAPKLGLMTAEGPDHSGHVICNDLGLGDLLKEKEPAAFHLNATYIRSIFPVNRAKNSHKGKFGHVLIIGGGEGMPGAVLMAAQAAACTGAGLVTIAVHPQYAASSVSAIPEALVFPAEKPEDLEPLLQKATVCVIGPGLGESNWAKMLWRKVQRSSLPLIIDASALRMLAKDCQQETHYNEFLNRHQWLLTPHPGEAASLLNTSTHEIQSNRLAALLALQKKYGGYIVLKGVGSLISHEANSPPYLCSAGNPGMATGGMGDVLSGILAALVAQGLSLSSASKLGVWIHATAGDEAAKRRGERGLLASDLMPYLTATVNQFSMISSE